MRFHKFSMPEERATEGYVDLDKVHAITVDYKDPTRTIIALPNGAITVSMLLPDVLALVQGPKVEFADSYGAEFNDHLAELNDAADELARLREKGASGQDLPGKLYANQRRPDIEDELIKARNEAIKRMGFESVPLRKGPPGSEGFGTGRIPKPMQDTADLTVPDISYFDKHGIMQTLKGGPASKIRAESASVDISEALKQGERRSRLDELDRLQSWVNRNLYGAMDGAGIERQFNAMIYARRAVLEA